MGEQVTADLKKPAVTLSLVIFTKREGRKEKQQHLCKPLFLSGPHFPLPTFVSCFFILQRLQGRVSRPHVCPELSTMADLSSPEYLEETLRTGPCTHFRVARPTSQSPLVCSVTVGMICAVENYVLGSLCPPLAHRSLAWPSSAPPRSHKPCWCFLHSLVDGPSQPNLTF